MEVILLSGGAEEKQEHHLGCGGNNMKKINVAMQHTLQDSTHDKT